MSKIFQFVNRRLYEQEKKRSDVHSEHAEGFTFVETLCVIAITALLTSGTLVSATRLLSLARRTTARTQIEQFRSALQAYFYDCGDFPTTEQGLHALWEKPTLHPLPDNWNGPYTEKAVPKDPWGSEFAYFRGDTILPSGTPEGLPFVIISYGSDKTAGGTGDGTDIISWQE